MGPLWLSIMKVDQHDLKDTGITAMATKAKSDLKTDRPTYTSDFIKSDIDQVVFLGNPILDNLTTTIVALCSEMWADRRRIRVLERLLADQGISAEMVEGYMPTAEDEAEWKAERDRFIGATLGPILQTGSLPVSADWQDKD